MKNADGRRSPPRSEPNRVPWNRSPLSTDILIPPPFPLQSAEPRASERKLGRLKSESLSGEERTAGPASPRIGSDLSKGKPGVALEKRPTLGKPTNRKCWKGAAKRTADIFRTRRAQESSGSRQPGSQATGAPGHHRATHTASAPCLIKERQTNPS